MVIALSPAASWAVVIVLSGLAAGYPGWRGMRAWLYERRLDRAIQRRWQGR